VQYISTCPSDTTLERRCNHFRIPMAGPSSMLLRSGKHMTEADPIIVHAGPGTSRVISVHKREFPVDASNSSTIQYTQYRGTGVPLLDLGEPGDLFIDMTPETYRIFVRYQFWREWPGISEETGTSNELPDSRFTHPEDPTRIVWCTPADVMWYKIASARLGRVRLFSSTAYDGATFVPAHDLIQWSSIPKQGVNEKDLLADRDQPELKRRKLERSPTPGSWGDFACKVALCWE
jgi:hypothetical protein